MEWNIPASYCRLMLPEGIAELTYRVLCIDGFWYLHPEAFGTVLRNE